MCIWDVFQLFGNLTNVVYTYLITTYPITIILVYFLCVTFCGSYIVHFKNMCIDIDARHTLPYLDDEIHYEKGKWKYHTIRCAPKFYHQRITKRTKPQQRRKYSKSRKMKTNTNNAWAYEQIWTSLLDMVTLIFSHGLQHIPFIHGYNTA